MSASSNSNTVVWSIHSVGNIYFHDTGPNDGNTVRPVITLKNQL